MQVQKRDFDPYELNQLLKYSLNPNQFSATIQDPVEYLTGHVQFRDLDLHVSPDVLIPRVETEELVDLILNFVETLDNPFSVKIADVGTGSGAIGLSLAVELATKLTTFEVILGDISAPALRIAQQNAQELLSDELLERKVKFVESDLLTRFPMGPYTVIVANLPYIPSSRIPTLDTSVKEYEPWLALDGGDDGLDIISRLLNEVSDYLADEGRVFLEIDDSHTADQLEVLAPDFTVTINKDSANKNRFAILSKKLPETNAASGY